MSATKSSSGNTFIIFGEPIEIVISGETTGGLSTTLTQTSPPGGGPPPHSHRNEDETLHVLYGDYELLANGQWTRVEAGATVYAPRGSVHTFRNVGSTTGKMLVLLTPSGLEKYFEEIAPLSVPADMPQILAISERYGISFSAMS